MNRLFTEWRSMRQTLGWIGPWITLVSLSLWVASPSSLLLGFAALSIVVGFLGGVRERGAVWLSASIILVIGILTGVFADLQGRDLAANWNTLWSAREAVRAAGRCPDNTGHSYAARSLSTGSL